MPLPRCWNFNDSGSRKKWPNGAEKQCRPNCSFIHPSDPDWDRARSAPVRGGDGPSSGRGRSQSSFGAPATGANSSSLGPERGSSSAAWGDYMTGFGQQSSATSNAPGASSYQSARTTSGTSGWGDSGAGGSGWGSCDNNNVGASDAWSNELSVPGEQAPSSHWGTQTEGWGSSGDDWGTTGTDLGPGWGEASISDQTGKAPSAAVVTNVAGLTAPDAMLGSTTWTDGDTDMATAMTSSSRAMALGSSPSEPDTTHSEQHDDDSPAPATVDKSPSERKASSTATSFLQSSTIKSMKTRPPRNGRGNYVVSSTDEMSNLILHTAMTLKMRELDVEISRLSGLRKSQQVVTTRAAKDLLRNKVQKLTDARVTVEAEHNDCSRVFMQSDSLWFPFVRHALITLGQNNEQLKQLKDWISETEGFLGLQAEASPTLSIKGCNGITHVNKLNQLKQRSDCLEDTGLLYQDPQFHNTFLDHQIQEKKGLIIAAIIKSQDITHNHLLSTSLSTLQRQGEMWNQALQIQSREFAQALLQSNQFKEDNRRRPMMKAKKKDTIQQLQADIVQKKSQLQALQQEITQLQHTLNSQQQQDYTITKPHEYASCFQDYIEEYIQTNIISNIKSIASNSVAQTAAIESETVKKIWKALQPFLQISILLQDSDIYKSEDEMEIREIEESL